MDGIQVRGRLAPSPTGSLHLGNALTFLLAWLSVRSQGGLMILRIEDLQEGHKNTETIQENIRDLKRLGLDWDEGEGVGGSHGSYQQSKRRIFYRTALERLIAGGWVYPCVCSRKDVRWAQGAPHADEYQHYDGRCRDRFQDYASACSASENRGRPIWRFRVPNREIRFIDALRGLQCVNVAQLYGDFPIARDPDGAGYQLASTLDDALMGVTEVLRGEDLLPATAWQRWIAEALALPPVRYIHTPLLVDSEGIRLAKRHDSTRLGSLFEQGISSEKIIGHLAALAGFAEYGEQLSPSDLIHRFDISKLLPGPYCWTGRIGTKN